jgi:RNA polymerase sigma factor (sigma-70 family)
MAEAHPSPLLQHIRHLIGDVPAAGMTDGQLLDRFLASRDEAAVEILVRRYGPLVLGICRRVLHNAHAAEDAFQATFLVLVRKAPSLDRYRPLGSWLYTVAYRLALRARANEARRRRCEGQAARGRPEAAGAAAPGDRAVALEEELQRLPEKHRAPLVLCYLEGKTNEQAARELGWPPGSMSRRLAQARDLLRERLARRGFACPAPGVAALLTAAAAPAAVPLPLLADTVRAALWFAAEGPSAAGFVSAQAVALAKGALKAMLTSKLKIATGLLLAVTVLGGGATLLVKAAPQAPPAPAGAPEKPRGEPGPGRGDAAEERRPAGAVARLGTARLRHGGGIFFATYTPDGKALLTAGKDQTVRLWDLATGQELRRFDLGGTEAEGEPEDRSGLEPGGTDGTVVLRGKLERRMLADLGWNLQAGLSPDGRVVAATRGGTVRLWEAATGKKLRELKTGQPVVMQMGFSPDGKSVLTLGPDRSAAVWEVATGKRVKQVAGRRAADAAGGLAAVSPDFRYLAWQHVDVASQSFSVKVMDLTAGKELPQVKAPVGGAHPLAFSPDGKTLAWAGFQGGFVLWDVAAGKERRRLGGRGLGVQEPVTAFAFSPDGRSLAASRANGTMELWDLASGQRTHRIGEAPAMEAGMMILIAGPGTMARSALAFAPDGKRLAASLGGPMIRQFDAATGKEISGPAGGHRAPVAPLGLSADGKSLRTYGRGDPVRVWDLATGKETRPLPLPGNATCVAFSAGGGRFASAAGRTITLHDAAGREVRKVESGPSPVAALALSPDGAVLAARGALNPRVKLWDAATGKELATLGQAEDAPRGAGFAFSETSGVLPEDLVFSPDGRYLVGAGSKRQLCLWDVGTGEPVWEVAPAAGQAVERFAFSPNGRCLAALNGDGTVTLYEAATGAKRGRLGEPDQKAGGGGLTVSFAGMSFLLAERRDVPVCLAFSPDGRYLAVAQRAPDIRLWDVVAGREVGRLKGHEGGVVSLLFTPDGRRLLSGGMDTTVLTWDVTRLTGTGPARGARLDARALDALWADLAGEDAEKAFDALRRLSASPGQAAGLVKERLRPASPPDAKRVARLVADLQSERFEVRRQAEAELEGLGELAGPPLRKVLDGDPPLDLRQRVQRLLRRLSGLVPAAGLVRDLRAVELLELAGGPESRQVLEALAGGAAGSRVTREAKAAARRLAKRAAATP